MIFFIQKCNESKVPGPGHWSNQLTGGDGEFFTPVATPMLVPLRNHIKTSVERGVRNLRSTPWDTTYPDYSDGN